jgi:hypothetical protein
VHPQVGDAEPGDLLGGLLSNPPEARQERREPLAGIGQHVGWHAGAPGSVQDGFGPDLVDHDVRQDRIRTQQNQTGHLDPLGQGRVRAEVDRNP